MRTFVPIWSFFPLAWLSCSNVVIFPTKRLRVKNHNSQRINTKETNMTCKVDIYANWKSSSFPCVFLFCVGSLLLGFDGTAENRSVWTAAGRDVAHTQWAERFWSVSSGSESVAIMLGPNSTSVPTKQPARAAPISEQCSAEQKPSSKFEDCRILLKAPKRPESLFHNRGVS